MRSNGGCPFGGRLKQNRQTSFESIEKGALIGSQLLGIRFFFFEQVDTDEAV